MASSRVSYANLFLTAIALGLGVCLLWMWVYRDRVEIRSITSIPAWIEAGTTLTCEFELRNLGWTEVRIAAIKRICDCQNVVINSRDLAAGAATKMLVETKIAKNSGYARRDIILDIRGTRRQFIRAEIQLKDVHYPTANEFERNSNADFGLIQDKSFAQRKIYTPPDYVLQSIRIAEHDKVYLSSIESGVLSLGSPNLMGQVSALVQLAFVDKNGKEIRQDMVCRGRIDGPLVAIPAIGLLKSSSVTTFHIEPRNKSADFALTTCDIVGEAAGWFSAIICDERSVRVSSKKREDGKIVSQPMDVNGGNDGRLVIHATSGGNLIEITVPLFVEIQT